MHAEWQGEVVEVVVGGCEIPLPAGFTGMAYLGMGGRLRRGKLPLYRMRYVGRDKSTAWSGLGEKWIQVDSQGRYIVRIAGVTNIPLRVFGMLERHGAYGVRPGLQPGRRRNL